MSLRDWPIKQKLTAMLVLISGLVLLLTSAAFRAIDDITNQQVPAYAELNATLTWRPASSFDLSLVGQNLLHSHHGEFGAPATRRRIERGMYGTIAWHF